MNTQTAIKETSAATDHEIVSSEEWLMARKALLAKEKELTRLRDELSRQRLELPWEKVRKSYVFEGAKGKESLADLFEERSQLIVYHFMFGPDWPEGCTSCSMVADHLDASVIHLAQRDVTLVVASRARREQIETFQKRMGWHFNWVSAYETDFNRDYRVSFTKEEMADGAKPYNYGSSGSPSTEAHGISVFYKDTEGDIFHTYSAYARGVEEMLGVYSYLDLAPKGRDEGNLPYPMAWVRHHDHYEASPSACCSGEEHG